MDDFFLQGVHKREYQQPKEREVIGLMNDGVGATSKVWVQTRCVLRCYFYM